MIKLKRCIVTPIAIVGCQLLGACGGSSGSAAETSGEATLDVKRLPIGDGKVSSTPRVGYVFACSIPTASAASRSVPWISSDGMTWDSTAKITVQGSVEWVSSFAQTLGDGFSTLTGNGLPSHTTGLFPIKPADPAYQYDPNPNSIASAVFNWALPSNPVVAAAPTCTGLGAIGVLLTGARLFNALDADGRDAVAHEVQDQCNGHPQGRGVYHYHNVSSCITQASASGSHSPLVGYIADGFGLYGNLGEGGKPLTNADLDECHGHTHSLTVGGRTVTQYHYHATSEYPYTVGCFKGTPVAIN